MERKSRAAKRQNNRSGQLEAVKLTFQCSDILKQIFKNLPTLKNVNLVSKEFYQVAEEMRQEKGWIWIKNENFVDDKALFQSMIQTKRIFHNCAIGESSQINAIDFHETSDEFLTEQWYFKAIRTVVGLRHGQEIQQLQLMNVDISMENLLDLLAATPRVKLLKLFFVRNTEAFNLNRMENLFASCLPEISDLIIYECSLIASLIEFLPPNSVKSITIKAEPNEHLDINLQHQKSIVKLNLSSEAEEPLPIDLFENLKLTHLSLNVKSAENLSTLLAQQTSLVFLDISSIVIDNETFLRITELSGLEKLKLNVSEISLDIFVSITKLINLKCLSLGGGLQSYWEVISHGRFKLEKFEIINWEVNHHN